MALKDAPFLCIKVLTPHNTEILLRKCKRSIYRKYPEPDLGEKWISPRIDLGSHRATFIFYGNSGPQQECASDLRSVTVSGKKLKLNFVGIKVRKTKKLSYYNSLHKHRGHDILRYYSWKKILCDV